MNVSSSIPKIIYKRSVLDASNINYADTTWVLICTGLVFLMIPGVGYYYAATVRNKNKLTILMASFIACAITSIEWFLWGYSLSFSITGTNKFIGNLDNIVLSGVGNNPTTLAATIPQNTFMIYECMFACVTSALTFGGAAERFTLRGFIVFIFFWTVFVYDVVAYWVWGLDGWLRTLGALDYAGGTPVHIVSGFSALAYSIAIGPRKGFPERKFLPENISEVFIGTTLLWFGWFGFNGGSEVAINSRAANAVIVTNLAGSMGGITWVLTEMLINRSRKMSLYGFCNGIVSGFVCVTPASGFVSPASSLVFGALAGPICLLACKIKTIRWIRFDDACDVFGIHGVGGVLGGLLTALFADHGIATMAGGAKINGGWINHHWIQLAYQLAGVAAGAGWAFVVTFLLVKLVDLIPFLRLRLSADEEDRGNDMTELGEEAFGKEIAEIHELLGTKRSQNYIPNNFMQGIGRQMGYGNAAAAYQRYPGFRY